MQCFLIRPLRFICIDDKIYPQRKRFFEKTPYILKHPSSKSHRKTYANRRKIHFIRETIDCIENMDCHLESLRFKTPIKILCKLLVFVCTGNIAQKISTSCINLPTMKIPWILPNPRSLKPWITSNRTGERKKKIYFIWQNIDCMENMDFHLKFSDLKHRSKFYASC